jgi:hypothetical protein
LGASLHGHLEIVTLLLQDSRVDPSADNNSAIQSASLHGHLESAVRENREEPFMYDLREYMVNDILNFIVFPLLHYQLTEI